MNKKGIFMPFLVIFILFILGYSYYTIVIQDSEDKLFVIGVNQGEILKSYEEGEKYYLNLKQATKYSLDKSVNNFTKYSGVKEICNGKWIFYDENCNPSLENNFIILFKEELSNYGYKDNDISIENNFLIIKDNFVYKNEKKNFKLEYNSPFAVNEGLKLNVTKLNNLKNEIDNCVSSTKEKKDVNGCISGYYKHEQNGNVIKFTVPIEKEIKLYTDKLEKKKLDFVFYIDLDNTGLKTVF